MGTSQCPSGHITLIKAVTGKLKAQVQGRGKSLHHRRGGVAKSKVFSGQHPECHGHFQDSHGACPASSTWDEEMGLAKGGESAPQRGSEEHSRPIAKAASSWAGLPHQAASKASSVCTC